MTGQIRLRKAFRIITEITVASVLSAVTGYWLAFTLGNPCIAAGGQILVTATAITLIAQSGFGDRASFTIVLMGTSFGMLAVFFSSPLFFDGINLVPLWAASSIVPPVVGVLSSISQPHIRRGV